MKLWLIRHAEAVEADEFSGSDLERPLTSGGRRSAQAAFSSLARVRSGPSLVISSNAVRAWETARIFCLAFGIPDYQRNRLLNPGCSFSAMKKIVEAIPDDCAFAAIVGHEPDLSGAVSLWTSGGRLSLVLKKGGVVELDIRRDGTVDLVMAFPPDILNIF